MIKTFRSKGLEELWATGSSARISFALQKRILLRLEYLERCVEASEMNIPGFNYHALLGFSPTRHTVHVNGPWCITFEFSGGHAYRVELEQYH